MKDLKIALAALALATVLLGLVYPAVVTVAAQAAFPRQAAGDPDLIGVAVTDPRDLWGRPSATAPGPYNAMASTATNAGPLSPALADAVKQRIAALRAADPTAPLPVPADLVTSSASGLDPHISPAAAYYQAPRIARARGLAVDQVRAVIAAHVEGPQLGVLGDPRVNVRAVNRALDAAVR